MNQTGLGAQPPISAGSTAPTWFETMSRDPVAGKVPRPRRWNFEPSRARVRSRARRVRRK
jgi:hypothetical protein